MLKPHKTSAVYNELGIEMIMYVVISIPNTCLDDWQGHHHVVKADITRDEVQLLLDDEQRTNEEAIYLGLPLSKSSLDYMPMDEYNTLLAEHNAFTYGGNGEY